MCLVVETRINRGLSMATNSPGKLAQAKDAVRAEMRNALAPFAQVGAIEEAVQANTTFVSVAPDMGSLQMTSQF